jgi:transcriptional regulator with XRE-family HTH domain
MKLDLKAMGSRIRGLRGDLRQDVLARSLGVSQGQLSKVERGRLAPTLRMLVAIANQFGRTLDWIVWGEGKDAK